MSKKVNLSFPVFDKKSKHDIFNMCIDDIYIYLQEKEDILNYNKNTKKEIYDNLEKYIQTLKIIHDSNEELKYCDLYLSTSYDQLINIKNLFVFLH